MGSGALLSKFGVGCWSADCILCSPCTQHYNTHTSTFGASINVELAAQVVRTDLVSVMGSSDSVIVCTLVRTGPGFAAVCSVPAHITTTHIQVPSVQVLVLS